MALSGKKLTPLLNLEVGCPDTTSTSVNKGCRDIVQKGWLGLLDATQA